MNMKFSISFKLCPSGDVPVGLPTLGCIEAVSAEAAIYKLAFELDTSNAYIYIFNLCITDYGIHKAIDFAYKSIRILPVYKTLANHLYGLDKDFYNLFIPMHRDMKPSNLVIVPSLKVLGNNMQQGCQKASSSIILPKIIIPKEEEKVYKYIAEMNI